MPWGMWNKCMDIETLSYSFSDADIELLGSFELEFEHINSSIQ